MAEDMRVVLKLDNLYGMIVLLGLGLVGGAITFMAEVIKKMWETHKKNSKGKSTIGIHTEEEVEICHGALFTMGIVPKEDEVTEIERILV